MIRNLPGKFKRLFSVMKQDSEPEVKSEAKIEEDISVAELIKTEIKKEEIQSTISKCFICSACSLHCSSEELFLKHIQEYHVTSYTHLVTFHFIR